MPSERPPAVRLMRNLGLEPDPWQMEVLTCRDEKQQVELLQRFHDEGIQVKALIS